MTVDSLRWISFKRISRWVMLCCSPRVLPLLLFTCPICSTLHWKTLRLLCVCVVLVSVSVTAATQSRFIRNPSISLSWIFTELRLCSSAEKAAPFPMNKSLGSNKAWSFFFNCSLDWNKTGNSATDSRFWEWQGPEEESCT